MRVHVAEITPYGSPIIVAIVPSEFTEKTSSTELIDRIEKHQRIYSVMLVSVERNGFRTHAKFQTHVLLALIQLEYLDLVEIDLDQPAFEDPELPF